MLCEHNIDNAFPSLVPDFLFRQQWQKMTKKTKNNGSVALYSILSTVDLLCCCFTGYITEKAQVYSAT